MSTSGNLYRPVEVERGKVDGEQRPQLGSVAFALWTLRELGRVQGQSLRRTVTKAAGYGRGRSELA